MTKAAPQPEVVGVDETGERTFKTDMDVDISAFDAWNCTACMHEMGELVSHRIGNVAGVAFLRSCLAQRTELFPILLAKVLYSGVHCGDWLRLDNVARVRTELDGLHRLQVEERWIIDEFRLRMQELVDASLRVGTPIVF